MPELPEVETVCRGLSVVMTDRVLTRLDLRRPDLRRPIPPDLPVLAKDERILGLRRRAKYWLIDLANGLSIIGHLGMSGRMTAVPLEAVKAGRLGAHDHVVFHLSDGQAVVFNDPRRFGMIDVGETAALDSHPWFRGMGPEPLEDSFTPAVLSAALAGKKTPIKAALLDQKVVAGLGNIYVSEALYHARISPRRLAHSVAGARCDRLVPAIKQVLTAAIAAGGSTLRDYVQATGSLGYFQHSFAVYGRAGRPCPDCDCQIGITGGVQRMVQSGRSTFYCGRLQR